MRKRRISKALAVLLSALLLCGAGTAAFAQEAPPGADTAVSASPAPQDDSSPAVSYTHLTLPTNSLV